ncbi:MAG: sulfatase-like hydrolase/transferase [Lachnospiraceae bacterium]|nr:sulfatase-like hydrolase/transferase [Lachnospiraceae bacterium]
MNKSRLRFEIQILALSVSLGLTIFFFSPYELLRCNQPEFLLYPQDIIPALAISAVVGVLAFILVLNILMLINTSLFRLVRSLLFGFLVGCYVQLLFYNGRMTLLNEEADTFISVDETSPYSIVNFIIMLVLYFAPVVITAIQIDNEKKGKKLLPLNPMVIAAVSGAILLMQTAGAVQVSMQYKLLERDTAYPKHLTYFSYEGVSSLSKESNIMLFVVDRLDGDWFDRTLAAYPELNETLDGFTLYRDNVSRYSVTFPSVPHMLTGRAFNDQSWEDFLSDAWSGTNLLSRLSDNGYSVNLCMDSNTTYLSANAVSRYADNIVSPTDEDVEKGELYSINYIGKDGVIPIFLRYSLAKLMPYYYKSLFLIGVGTNPAEEFVVFTENHPERQPNPTSTSSDLAYYNYLTKVGISTNSTKKVFTFVHLDGPHDPDDSVAALVHDKGAAAPDLTIATARGSFEIIGEVIRQLKETGVYDNTTIIIVGDHGRKPEYMYFTGLLDDKTVPILTALLIKPANAAHAPLTIDNTSPTSNEYIPATILQYAGIDSNEYGISVQDLVEQGLHPDRLLGFLHFNGFFNSQPVAFEYKISGPARDIASWTCIRFPEEQ